MDEGLVGGDLPSFSQVNIFLKALRRRTHPVRLKPHGGRERGLVVLSYLREPLTGAAENGARGHTNWQECRVIAEAWREQGFRVEAVAHHDRGYVPPAQADFVVDLGVNLGRWAAGLPPQCCKILHATGAHWRTQNAAEETRLRNLLVRRGVQLQPRRQNLPNCGIESADLASVLGNEFTIDSFRFAGKPLHRIPISSAYEYAWSEDRDWEATRRNFLWIGSYGMVHKGLDLVLEAFAAMPDLHLTVCGRPDKEEDFWRSYQRELTGCPNIHFEGWVDLASARFANLRRTHGAVVCASASEGGGGAVIHAMHAGLVPVVTPGASVDTGAFGEVIRGDQVEDVCLAVQATARQPASLLRQKARATWEYVRAHHNLGRFAENYRRFVLSCTGAPAGPVDEPVGVSVGDSGLRAKV
jgi:glycosyltransferase involved in cell wall biosynthesis